MSWSWSRWVGWLDRHRRSVVFGSIVVCILSGWSLTHLRLDVDVVGMLPRGRAAFDDFKAFVTDFGQLDELVILLEGDSPVALRESAELLVPKLTTMESVASVNARLDFNAVSDGILGRHLLRYVPVETYDEIEQRLSPEKIGAHVAGLKAALAAPLDLQAAGEIARDPLGLRRAAAVAMAQGSIASAMSDGWYVSTDGSAMLIFVRPRGSGFDITFSKEFLRKIAEIAREVARPGVSIRWTGSYAFALEDAATMQSDILRHTVFSLLGVMLVFYIGYRNFRVLPFVTYPLIVITLLTFAFSLVLFDELNALSISFAAILYGLSIDAGIYFYTRFLIERGRGNRVEAVAATLSGLWRANVVASATTAAGFSVIGFSCLSAVSQLGILTAIGMVFGVVIFLVLQPTLALMLSDRAMAALSGPLGPRGSTLIPTPRLGEVAAISRANGHTVCAVSFGLAVLMFAAATQTSTDLDLGHLRPQDSAALAVQLRIEERFADRGGAAALMIERPTLEAALRDAEQLENGIGRLRAEGLLSGVRSLSPFLPSHAVQEARLARLARMDRPELARQLREEMVRQGFRADRIEPSLQVFLSEPGPPIDLESPDLAPLRSVLERHVRKHGQSWIVASYLQPTTGMEISKIADRMASESAGVPYRFASRGLLETELKGVLSAEFGAFLGFALLGNLVLLLMTFRNLRDSLGVLAPAVLAILCVMAGMFFTDIALNPVNLVVIPLVLGVGVDYGVYAASAAREAGSWQVSLTHSGRAHVITALTTVVGFAFLGLSRYPALSSLGTLAGSGLLLSLLFTLSLLPALFNPLRSRT